MNVSNATTTTASAVLTVAQWISAYFFSIILPVFSLIGLLFSLLAFAVLVNPRLSGDIYKLMILKNLFNMYVSWVWMLGMFSSCVACGIENTFFAVVYSLVLTTMFASGSFLGSALTEIALALESFRLLNNFNYKHCCGGKYSVKVTIVIILATVLVLISPYISISNITEASGVYTQVVNTDYRNGPYRYYSIVFSTFSAVTVIVVLVVNIFVVRSFRRLMERKRALAAKSSADLSQHGSSKMFRMIMGGSCFFMLARLYEAATTFWNIAFTATDTLSTDANRIARPFYQVLHIMSIVADFFVYFNFNKNFRAVMLGYLRKIPYGKEIIGSVDSTNHSREEMKAASATKRNNTVRAI